MKSTLITILASPALALMVAGCMGSDPNAHRSLDSGHTPVVQRIDYAFDVRQSGSGGLAEGEINRLNDWFRSMRLGYSDHVSIDEGRSAYRDTESRDAVGALAARYGLLVNDGAPVTAGQIPEGSIRVVLSRVTATVPDCPDWSRRSQPDYSGATMSNFGCSVNSNLAAMIANPEDLIEGQTGESGIDGRLSAKAIKSYRDKPATGAGGLLSSSTKGQ